MSEVLLGAIATIGAATLGLMAVIWQIGRQAQHAIKQNQHNESLKLKLNVYEEIVSVCRAAANTEVELSTYIRQFETDIELYKDMTSLRMNYPPPRARATKLSDLREALSKRTIEIISLTERWQIIDPRIELIRTAINVANHDIVEAFTGYFTTAISLMPYEKIGTTQQGSLFPWYPPEDSSFQQLKDAGQELLDALMDLGCYIYDIQVEMQNLLLGELFNRKIPPRDPIDPKLIVLRLDRFKELTKYFEQETAWGRNKAEIKTKFERAVQQSLKIHYEITTFSSEEDTCHDLLRTKRTNSAWLLGTQFVIS